MNEVVIRWATIDDLEIIQELNNMFIEDEDRGYGIGKLLIDNYKKYCKDKGINNFKEFDLTLTMEI